MNNFQTRLKDELSIVRMWFETYDDKKLQLTHGGSTLVLLDNLGAPEMQTVTARGVGQHGDVFVDTFFEPRMINVRLKQLDCGCVGICAADCTGLASFSTLATLTNLLRFRGGVGLLKCQFKNGAVRQLKCWPVELPKFLLGSQISGVQGGTETTFRLYAPSPFWESETEYELSDVVRSGNYARVTARNRGSVESKPYITFSMTHGHGVDLENVTTGRSIALRGLEGKPITITIDLQADVRNRPVTKIMQGDVDVSYRVINPSELARFVVAQSPFAANGENIIRAQAVTDGLFLNTDQTILSVKWRDVFLGAIV